MAMKTPQESRHMNRSAVEVRDAVSVAVERWYDFPEFGGYLGNVGISVRPQEIRIGDVGFQGRRGHCRGGGALAD